MKKIQLATIALAIMVYLLIASAGHSYQRGDDHVSAQVDRRASLHVEPASYCFSREFEFDRTLKALQSHGVKDAKHPAWDLHDRVILNKATMLESQVLAFRTNAEVHQGS